MSSIYIVRRQTKTGKARWHVRMEHGRADPVVHLGVFATETLAKERVKSARKELAQGIEPAKRPKIEPAPTVERPLKVVAAEWVATRIDVVESTRRNYAFDIEKIEAVFAKADPAAITVADVQDWIGKQAGAAGTIGNRLNTFAQILDHAEVDPNPARSRRLRKPRKPRAVYRLPTRADLTAMYTALDERVQGVVRLMEHGGLRVSEAIAIQWGDLDRPRSRLLVRKSKTNAGTRWVEQIDGKPVFPERPVGARDTDRVYSGVTDNIVRHSMRDACVEAKIAHYSPHALRHLHASRLLHEGKLSPAQLAARLGHATPQITLNTYSHVVPPD